jgi:2-amino-4-hydroxy-6-hydroxymethyldihydropteridine diphosphokinase
MTQAYLGLGSNIGDASKNIEQALAEIGKWASVLKVSSFYKTKPWGLLDQPDFVNAVASIETNLTAEELLGQLLMLEKTMGRERRERWGPRLIDLDILTYGDQTIRAASLTIPHPHMHERAFVLVPLVEIDEQFGRSLKKLTREDVDGVQKISS